MYNATPTLVRDAGSGSELCQTCGHPLQVHDVISRRWCAATELGLAVVGASAPAWRPIRAP